MTEEKLELSTELQALVSQNPVELLDVDNLETQTMEHFKEQKQRLAEMRQQVTLWVDGKKLEQSLKVLEAMDNTIDSILDPECTPKDRKALTGSLRDLTIILSNLSRLDTIDGYGGAKGFYIDLSGWK